MAATDGYRLSVRSIVLDKASVKEPMTVIVPLKPGRVGAHQRRRR